MRGSTPASNIFHFLNFSLQILYPTRHEAYHMPSMFNHQISKMSDLTPILWRFMMHPSQAMHRIMKGQHGPRLIGPKNCYGHPPCLLITRPISLFSFIFFLLFILFNLFSHKINSFFTKTHKNQFHQI